MSNDRLRPLQEVAELIDGAIRRAHIAERLRCANLVAMYPLEGFCYDTNNHGEILRLRDTLSEAILKDVPKGERIR